MTLLDQAEGIVRSMGAEADLAEVLAARAECLFAAGSLAEARAALTAAEEACPAGHAEAEEALARARRVFARDP